MDLRINQVTAWYNRTLEDHKGDKSEFNKRFADEEGQVDLSNPDVALGYGRLEKEGQLLERLGAILQGEVVVENVAQAADANIDKT